jgi:hypothetical protein
MRWPSPTGTASDRPGGGGDRSHSGRTKRVSRYLRAEHTDRNTAGARTDRRRHASRRVPAGSGRICR